MDKISLTSKDDIPSSPDMRTSTRNTTHHPLSLCIQLTRRGGVQAGVIHESTREASRMSAGRNEGSAGSVEMYRKAKRGEIPQCTKAPENGDSGKVAQF